MKRVFNTNNLQFFLNKKKHKKSSQAFTANYCRITAVYTVHKFKYIAAKTKLVSWLLDI